MEFFLSHWGDARRRYMRRLGLLIAFMCVALALPEEMQAREKSPASSPKKAGIPARSSMVTLQDTINATLRNHNALKVIQENREVVIHELDRAKAGYGPRVDINGRLGVSQLSTSTTRAQESDYGFYGAGGIGATLVQPLWDGWATRSRVRTAEATVNSMTHRVFDNATTLALDSIIAHIDVLRRRKILQLSEDNVRRHQEILASSRDRESMGADTMADVTQTEGRLARALASLAEAKASLLEGETAYRRLTGLPVPLELEPVELPQPMYQGTMAVLETAEKHNPKIAAYIEDVKAAMGNRELAESTFYPTVNLEAGPNYSDRGGPYGPGGYNENYTASVEVMGTLRWNIFNSGADVAEVRAASARTRQARQTLYSFMDDLTQEVENSWTGYQSAIEQRKNYLDAIQYNVQTRDAYLEQFYLGQRSLLDVLDAENELFNSSTQAATAQGNILVGAYRLYGLAGVLLPHLHIDTKDLYKAPGPGHNDDKPIMDFK